jgi:hypothetical protein
LDRKEAIALLFELGTNQLVSPDLVILEQRKLDSYQLKIKGYYNIQDVGQFLKDKFSFEVVKEYLIISSL